MIIDFHTHMFPDKIAARTIDFLSKTGGDMNPFTDGTWKGLKEYGADEVYGIAFDTILEKNQCCKNMIEVAARAMELQGRELANYEKEGIDHLITICLKKVALLDSNQIDVLYKMGYEETKKQLNLLKKSTK